jgi:hypothetical protein
MEHVNQKNFHGKTFEKSNQGSKGRNVTEKVIELNGNKKIKSS